MCKHVAGKIVKQYYRHTYSATCQCQSVARHVYPCARPINYTGPLNLCKPYK